MARFEEGYLHMYEDRWGLYCPDCGLPFRTTDMGPHKEYAHTIPRSGSGTLETSFFPFTYFYPDDELDDIEAGLPENCKPMYGRYE